MTKLELQHILKPLIKQCLKEIIFEEKGIISHIIKESIEACSQLNQLSNISNEGINYNPSSNKQQVRKSLNESFMKKVDNNELRKDINENRRMLENSIGLKGVFEGTKPLKDNMMTEGALSVPSPLSGIDPEDPGVNVESLLGGMRKFKF